MTEIHHDANLNPDRVRAIIVHAMNGLDPTDRAERIAWCQQHDAHGVRMFPAYDDNDVIEFRWGNRQLAMIRRDVLLSDEPLVAEFNADCPDTVPDDL